MAGWDVVIVGGGAMGTAAARSVARLGRSCLLLERFRIGHDRGSSHGPTRIFRLAYHDPAYVRMAAVALEDWHGLEEEAGERLLVRTGGLDAGPGAQVAASALDAAGVSFEWLRPAEVVERWPGLRLEGHDRVLHQEDAGVCLADRTVSAQARVAREAGAEILEETGVEGIVQSSQGVEVRTRAGSHRATAAVVTAGAWAPGLLARAGLAVPLTVSLEQVSYFGADTGHLPTLIEWGSPPRYAVPDPAHPGRLKAAEHGTGPPIDPDAEPREPSAAAARRVEAWAADRFEGARAEASETCLYTTAPDEDFVIDRDGALVVGSACSGHGFKFAPLVGRLLAELACGERPSFDLSAFALGRPALRATSR